MRLQEWGGAENRIKKNVPGTFKNPMGVEKLRGDSCYNLISLCRHRGRGTSGVSLRSPRQWQGAVLETKKKRNKQALKAPCVFSCAQSARWQNERGQRTESVELRLAPSRIPYGAEITLGDSCIWYRYAGRGQVGLSEATNCWDWRENCIHKTTRYSSPPWRISVESLPRQEWSLGMENLHPYQLRHGGETEDLTSKRRGPSPGQGLIAVTIWHRYAARGTRRQRQGLFLGTLAMTGRQSRTTRTKKKKKKAK